MARFSQIAVIAITLLLCVGCDQGAKALAKEYLPRNEVITYVHDTFRLQYAENKGSFLGIGSSLPHGDDDGQEGTEIGEGVGKIADKPLHCMRIQNPIRAKQPYLLLIMGL